MPNGFSKKDKKDQKIATIFDIRLDNFDKNCRHNFQVLMKGGVNTLINKRFPADTTLKNMTFLNDKKIDAELYAFLISYSYPNENNQTETHKTDLPTQPQICEKINIKSTTTYRTHIKYLIDSGYIVDTGESYIFPRKEDIYFDIPLATLQFLNDTVQEPVIKAYIYLGQRNKYKSGYIFTLEELAEHIGIKLKGHQREYIQLNNILRALELCGLLETRTIQEGRTFRQKITNFSYNIKNTGDNF